jgi:nicotinate-nucleotide adenylyltransferase
VSDRHPSPPLRRIGVLGGTFDPVHIGHLIIAQEVAYRLELSVVLFVPARVSPFKRDAEAAPAEDRAAMLELALAGEPRFRLSRADLERAAPSYTVDTLRVLSDGLGPDAELSFILGADALATFAEWRAPNEILRLARLACVTRPGSPVELEGVRAALPAIDGRVDLIGGVSVGVSSTDVRRRIVDGAPIQFHVPSSVERYIRVHGLYRSPYDSSPSRPCS